MSAPRRKTPWDWALEGAFHKARSPWFPKERERKLGLARLGRTLIETAPGDGLACPLDALFQTIASQNRVYMLVAPTVEEWTRAWASRDEASLRRALDSFRDPEMMPEERFAAFVTVAEGAQAAGLAPEGADEVMNLGSFLNFAVAPQTSPVFGPSAFTAELKQLKGLEPDTAAPLTEQYQEQLDFAGQIEAEMRAAEVEIADMLDVQSLVSLYRVRIMPGQEWEIFAQHAPYVLHNPLFDSEERDPCLEIARLGRALLRTGRDGGLLEPTLEALFEALLDPERNYPLVDSLMDAELEEWVRAWASFDEPSLRRALQCFVAPEKTPEERFAAFADVTEEARAIDLGPGEADAMTFGALMNFALAPESVPVVGSNVFTAQLWQLKGLDPAPFTPLVEGYRQHLDFARQVLLEANAAGVGVRDMLDLQSLVRVCASLLGEQGQDALWHPLGFPTSPYARCFERQLRGGARRQDIPYLAVCACLGYDAPYLLEWIEFHRLVGVERFFLYNRGDRDTQRELLAPYVEQGIVVLHEWTVSPPQVPAYDDCIERHRTDARWIAFIDTDEFLFSPADTPLVEVLADYEEWPAVGVGIVLFGLSGHRTKPDGLVIENYLQPLGLKTEKHIKSVVDPARTVQCFGGHHFNYGDRLPMDENHYPIFGAARSFNSFSRLRINHYYTKSEEEFLDKLSRPRKYNGEPYPEYVWQVFTEEFPSYYESSDDDAILGYVAPLKEVLAAISPSSSTLTPSKEA